MSKLLVGAAALALLAGFGIAGPAAAQSLGPVGGFAQCDLDFPIEQVDPAHCSISSGGTQVSASVRTTGFVLMKAFATAASGDPATSSAFLGYDYNITGGAAGDVVQISIATKLTTDLTGNGGANAELFWANGDTSGITAVCDSVSSAATACVDNHVFDGVITYDATVGDLQHLQIFLSTTGGLGGSGAATADPFISAHGITDPNAVYGIGIVQDVANAQPGVPEPAAWALLLTGFGLSGAALRRRRQGLSAA